MEFDRLRNHWRVTSDEHARLRLVDAPAQATGSRPDTNWTLKVEREITTEQPASEYVAVAKSTPVHYFRLFTWAWSRNLLLNLGTTPHPSGLAKR